MRPRYKNAIAIRGVRSGGPGGQWPPIIQKGGLPPQYFTHSYTALYIQIVL